MPFTPKQQAAIDAAIAIRQKQSVDPATGEPAGVPKFDPSVGQHGGGDSAISSTIGAAVTGAEDLPVVGPAMKAASAGGAALLTKGIDSVTGGSDASISQRYNINRDNQEAAMAEHPMAALAGNVAGTALAGGGLPSMGMKGAAALGAGIGGADAITRPLAEGRDPNLSNIATNALVGGAGGIVGHYMGKVWQDYLQTKGLGDKPLSEVTKKVIEERQAIENAAAQKMDASGVVISNNSIADLARNTIKELTPQGFSRDATPGAWKATQTLLKAQGRQGDMSLREFNTLRQNIRDSLPADASPSEVHMVGGITKNMNQFIKDLPNGKAGTVLSGDAMAGVDAWKDMNKYAMDRMKSEVLGRLFYNSELEASKRGTGKSLGQVLQSQASTFLKRKGAAAQDELSLFSPEETQTLEQLVKGTAGVGFDNMIEKYIGTGIVAGSTRAAIRGVGAAAKKLIGMRSDAATREVATGLLGAGGASSSIVDKPQEFLTPAMAELASRLNTMGTDHSRKIEAIMNAERMRATANQGLPQSTAVPAPTTPPVLPTQPPQFN